MLELLWDYCEGLPNWANRPIILKWGHSIWEMCLKMNIHEEFLLSKLQILFSCRIWLIEHNLFLTNDIVDFDKLIRIYKFAPIEAFRFERFWEKHKHPTGNNGFFKYRYSIKDLEDIEDHSKESYDYQIDNFAKRARQDSQYYMNRVNSFNPGKSLLLSEKVSSGFNKDEEDIISNLHCWNWGVGYKDKVFNFKFQCFRCSKVLCIGQSQNKNLDSEESDSREDNDEICKICNAPPVYASKIPIVRRKRMSTFRAKVLRKRPDKGEFKLILSANIRKKGMEYNKKKSENKEVFGKIFKRFKDIVIENYEQAEKEKEERRPRSWNHWNGLFTMINMAYKIIKCNHKICWECMRKEAFKNEAQKNWWSVKCPLWDDSTQK